MYERNIFTIKDSRFKSDSFLDEVKRSYTDLINIYVRDDKEKLKVFDKNSVYLPMQKVGKNNPKAEQIEAVLKSEIEESETILLQGVTKEERQEFLRIAEKMLQNLDTFPANTVKKNAGRKKKHGGRTDE